jgi:diguanylate cyclase (GGDEF)-like protein
MIEDTTDRALPAIDEAEPAPSSAYFVVLAGSKVGQMFKLTDGTTIIGRSGDADITIVDEGISRRHCEVNMQPSEGVVIKDRHSTNGTFVNGKRVDDRVLANGDKVQLGSTTILKFTYHDYIEESFQRQMFEAALRDNLTKAFNKKYFQERLLAEFSYAMRHGTYLTLLMMDLDFFKNVNDTYGHPAGDAVLKDVSKRILGSIRTEDVFARYGGEEFVVIGRGIRVHEGAILADRLRDLVARTPYEFNGNSFRVTISIGVAGVPDPRIRESDQLVAAADEALYEAKKRGRNRVVIQGT